MQIIHGDNYYESYRQAKELALKLAKRNNQELLIIDADELKDISGITSYLEAIDLFGSAKTVFAKRLFSSSKLTKQLETQVDLWSKDWVIWHDTKLDGRLSLVKEFKKQNILTEYPLLKSYQLVDWLIAEANKLKLKLSKPNAELLLSRLGEEQQTLIGELEKFTQIVEQGQSITNDLIETHSIDLASGDIWALSDAIVQKNLRLLHLESERMIKRGFELPYMISMIQRQLRIIAEAKYVSEHNLPSHLPPFQWKKIAPYLAAFSWQKVEQGYRDLLELDTRFKNGEIEASFGLTIYWQSLFKQ